LNETWQTKWQQHTIGNLGQVILILAPSTQISEMEQQIIFELLREIKHFYPGNKIFIFFLAVSLMIVIFSCIFKFIIHTKYL